MTDPSGDPARLSTTPDAADPTQIRITHPFHPLRGQPLRFVAIGPLWDEVRVTFEHPNGGTRSVPVQWTELGLVDPYLSVGRGRSRFRVEDLVALADLVQDRAKR